MKDLKDIDFPIGYICYESDRPRIGKVCKKCGSSLVRTHENLGFITFGLIDMRGDKCIHPKCENYYEKNTL